MPCNIESASLGKITIQRKDVYQEIYGFGGAVTDSAAMNIHDLTLEVSEQLLRYDELWKSFNFKRILLIHSTQLTYLENSQRLLLNIEFHIQFSNSRSYFGPHGINYNFIRTPMGGSDFSIRPYTYAMVENDTSFHHFELQVEDNLFKV